MNKSIEYVNGESDNRFSFGNDENTKTIFMGIGFNGEAFAADIIFTVEEFSKIVHDMVLFRNEIL
jgi:hypothetical protein